MSQLSSYLLIAGLAYRQAIALRHEIAGGPDQFPDHGDQPFQATEVACCEAVIATVRAVCALHCRILEFTEEGKARAALSPALEQEDDEHPQLEA